MKATRKFSETNGATVLLFAITMLLASCQKEEIQAPGLNQSTMNSGISNNSAEQTSRNDGLNHNHFPIYEVVTINHQPGIPGLGASYKVTLNNRGVVFFEGMRGVTHIGKYKYSVSQASLVRIQELLSESFYEISDDYIIRPHQSYVSTTFKMANDIAPKELLDNNKNYPQQLILLRQLIEEILGVSKYTKGRTEILFPAESEI